MVNILLQTSRAVITYVWLNTSTKNRNRAQINKWTQSAAPLCRQTTHQRLTAGYWLILTNCFLVDCHGQWQGLSFAPQDQGQDPPLAEHPRQQPVKWDVRNIPQLTLRLHAKILSRHWSKKTHTRKLNRPLRAHYDNVFNVINNIKLSIQTALDSKTDVCRQSVVCRLK